MQYKHEPLDSHLSLSLLNSVHNKKNMIKWAKKEKVNQKTALTRKSLYIKKMLYFHYMHTLFDVLSYQKILKGI